MEQCPHVGEFFSKHKTNVVVYVYVWRFHQFKCIFGIISVQLAFKKEGYAVIEVIAFSGQQRAMTYVKLPVKDYQLQMYVWVYRELQIKKLY